MNAKATTKRKPAAKKKPAAKRAAPKAKKPKTARETLDKASDEIVDAMKDIVHAQLGVYGEIYDELNSRMDKVRSDAPKHWKNLVKRGEQVQKDLEKARKDLRKNLEKTRADLKKNLEKAQKDLRKKVDKIRTA